MPKNRNSKKEVLKKRKSAMEAEYKELWNQGIDRSLIIEKIAEKFYLKAQTVREILKPQTIRKRLGLTTPRI